MHMIKSKALRTSFLLGAISWICFNPGYLRGQDVSTTNTSTESKPVPAEDLGTGIFSKLPFQFSVNVRTGYDDNVNNAPTMEQGSPFTYGSAAITYEFGSPRTKLSLGVGGGLTYYWDNVRGDPTNSGNNNYDVNSYLNLSLTHKVNPRLTLNLVTYLTYQTEPDFSIGQGINRRSGNYFYTSDRGSVSYLWTPRFSTNTSYTFGALHYDDNAVGFFDNRVENTFGNEFRFLIQPTTTIVVEYRLQIINYESIPRDSTTNFALAGFDHTFSPQLNISLRGGGQFRDEQEGASSSSPYFEGTLNYAVGKQTVVSWTNRYSIEEPDTALNPSRETFRTGLNAQHNITARVSGTLAAFYEHDDYQAAQNALGVTNTAFTEESVDVALTLRYAVTRHLGLETGYNYTDVWSDQPFRGYTRNRYWGGLNLTF
jgi:hypothetical protein